MKTVGIPAPNPAPATVDAAHGMVIMPAGYRVPHETPPHNATAMPAAQAGTDPYPTGHGAIVIPAPARVPLDAAPMPPTPLPTVRLPHFMAAKSSPYSAYWSPGEATPSWYDHAGDNQGDLTSFLAHADLASVAVLDFTNSPVPIDTLVLKLPILRILNFNGSPVTAFDWTGCPGLSELYCNNTGLTTLDISGSSIFTLECGDTPMTSLVLNNVSTTAICNNTLITSLIAPAHYSQLNFSGCASLTSVNVTGSIDFQLVGITCPSLQTLTLASSPIMMCCWLRGCALPQVTVDGLLHQLVLNGRNRGSALLNLGTNATPSATGLADKATLIASPRLWQVLTN